MQFLSTIFNEALYRPLLNILFLIYHYIPGHDMGVAVIFLTLLIRFIFYPLGVQAIKSQKKTAELQPKLKELQEKYKNDKEAQTKATMDLYKEHGFNPLSGCLPLLVQFPFIIALYQVFLNGLTTDVSAKIYSFMPQITQINTMFLGIVNLSQPNIVLAVVAGISQYFQFKTMPQQPKAKGQSDIAQKINNQMGYIFPIMMIVICWKIPSAVALYLITTTVFSIVQQLIIYRKDPKTN
jgi:YidC/Oxa1 family membrane protein insertase